MALDVVSSSPHRLDAASGQRIRQRRRTLDMARTALAEGLDTPMPAGSLDDLNDLLAHDGALDMPSADTALPSQELRRALLLHARALGSALDPGRKEAEGRSR